MKYKERKSREHFNDKMVTEIPGFINQLLLLLASGIVLNEALVTIARDYQKNEGEDNLFAKEYCQIYHDSQKSGRSMVFMLNSYGKQSRIKELSKLTGLLEDGEKKGIDLWEKLSEQSKSLWEERKKTAMEKIRLAETKMSFPLALLLIALIIITAAPAMMQM